jgi:transaldolase
MTQHTQLRNVKIYADGANLQQMLEASKNPLVKGFTTNPTLMRKAGIADYAAFAKEVLSKITSAPISFEVFSEDTKEMHRQARLIASWGPNVYVKIPVTNSEGIPTYELIKDLAGQGVKLNVTAIFDLEQVIEVTNALKGGAPSVVSVFAGRIADTGRDPMPIMAAAREICQSAGDQIELLWASPREFLNIIQADQVGCDIITVTDDLLKKMSLLNKNLRQFSLETVQMFNNDARQAGYAL